jgi:hypothetical protein
LPPKPVATYYWWIALSRGDTMTKVARRVSAMAVGVFAVAVGAACAPKATKEDCEKMANHMTDIGLEGQPADVAKAAREQLAADPKNKKEHEDLVTSCTGQVPKTAVDCMIAAKTTADIDKCK